MSEKALIVGISGQDGAYLANLLISKGYEVWGTSRDVQNNTFDNLKTLGVFDKVKLRSMVLDELKNVWEVFEEVNPDQIYSLAGQSSVGLSFLEPKCTIDSIFKATLNQLEVIRQLCPNVRFYNAGSSEIYGNANILPSNENSQFFPVSPYGVAKASSTLLVKLYRECYNIFACTGILFNHESPLRQEHFVTRKITEFVRQIQEDPSYNNGQLILGDLSIIRDWGWAPEYVEAMWKMLNKDSPSDYVIATGVEQSLKEFMISVFDCAGLDWQDYVVSDSNLFRSSDPKKTVGDPSNANKLLGWKPKTIGSEVARKLYFNELF